MKKERRYKISMMNGKEYNIDEADLAKLKQNTNEMLVQLKQVIVHPSSVVAIEPYFVEWIKQPVRSDMTGTITLEPSIPPKAIPDMFGNEILQLSESKKV